MGLNMNYRLLVEDNRSSAHIPDYKNYYNPEICTEASMMRTLFEFNQEVREASSFLDELGRDECCLNEAVSLTGIANSIMTIVDRVKNALIKVFEKINAFINNIIDSIEKKIYDKKDSVEKTYGMSDRVQLLNLALNTVTKAKESTVNIASIYPTKDLLDDNFPDVSVIGGEFVAICKVMVSHLELNPKSGDAGADDFEKYVEKYRNAMLHKTFKQYDYDDSSITQSAKMAATKAFGSNEKVETVITSDLYLRACDNIEKGHDIVSKMKKINNETAKNFKLAIREMDNVKKDALRLDKMSMKGFSDDDKASYRRTSKLLINRVNLAMNVAQQISTACYTMIVNKMSRIHNIFGLTGDSMTVKKACHRIIRAHVSNRDKHTGVSADHNTFSVKEAFNGLEQTKDVFDIFNEYDAFTVMAEELLRENEFNNTIMCVLNEADGDNTQSTNDNSTSDNNTNDNQNTNNQQNTNDNNNQNQQQNNTTNNKNDKKKFGGSILEWLKNLIGKFGNMLAKLKNRFDELVIKGEGKGFWANHKDGISKLNLTDTKVNQWFKFNLESFANSTFIKFDINSPDLKSDEAFQEAILHKITNNPPQADDKSSFTDRIKKAYQGEYIDDKNGDGKTLSEVGYDHTAAYTFIDDFCMKGFGGDTLGKVNQDYKSISEDHKNVSRSYESLKSQLPKDMEDKSNTQSQNADNTKSEPQNAAAIYDEDDLHFNLAEHFGLVHNEATFNVGNADSNNATENIGDDKDQNKAKSKVLDDMIRRCFNYNTIAVTAKMTAAVAAYKQYMGLYKAISKGRVAKGNKNDNNKKNDKNNENNKQNEKK